MKPLAATAIVAATLAATLAMASRGFAQFADQDSLAIKRLSDKWAQASGSGNLKPAFTTLFLARKNAKGLFATPAAQVVLQNDDRHAMARTVFYDAPTGQPDHADYALYFDGWPGTLSWTGGDRFLAVRGSQFTLDDGAKKLPLYVADVVDTYPGFEWLEGPFSIIRQSGHDEVYAVWSSRLNWPVYSPEGQVEGAILDGNSLGLTDAALIKAIKKNDWAARLAREADARKAFLMARADPRAKQVYKGTPVDVLPAYKEAASNPGQPAIDDPEAKIASSLDAYIPGAATQVAGITARLASPAWWVVSRSNRKVYILGVPWVFKDGVEWNQFRLSNRLRDLQGLIDLPPLLANEAPAGDSAAAIIPNAGKIPDDYRVRIQKAAAVIGKPADRYLDVSPLIAGYRLSTDYRSKFGLQPELVPIQINKTVMDMNFRASNAGTVHWPQSGANIPAPEAGVACLDAALNEVDAGPAAFNKAMEAWAAGDVRTALTAPRGLEQCSFAFPVESEIRRDGIKLQVDAIKQALGAANRGAVMVVYLRALLSEDGVLAQLQTQGYKIATPLID